MNIAMIGLDYKATSLDGREKASLTQVKLIETLKSINDEYGFGVAILSTCNRMEIYLASEEYISDELLLHIYISAFNTDALYYVKRADELINYLFELGCGLHSMIIGEDQIITQVGNTIDLSIEHKTSNSVLNTIFRHSVTCAKKAKTQVNVRFISPSIVQKSIDIAKRQVGNLSGKKVLVIGNGEMGRLCASLLESQGCTVYMTKRNYKYSSAIIPEHCIAVNYEDRTKLFGEVDMIFSATKSPHHTVYLSDVANLQNKPQHVFDLAVPRDVEPLVGDIKGVSLFDVDSISKDNAYYDQTAVDEIKEIIVEQKQKLSQWQAFYETSKNTKVKSV